MTNWIFIAAMTFSYSPEVKITEVLSQMSESECTSWMNERVIYYLSSGEYTGEQAKLGNEHRNDWVFKTKEGYSDHNITISCVEGWY